jgi:hypothetical protein
MRIAVSIQMELMGNEHSNPEIGERFEFVQANEIKISHFEKHLENKILKAFKVIYMRWLMKSII